MSNTFRIYLCGGISKFKKDPSKATEWREKVTKLFAYATNYRVKIFNPMKHFNYTDKQDYLSEREVMEYELQQLRKSDAVIYNMVDNKSIGSNCEMAIAYERRIPIFGIIDDITQLHPWQLQMCHRIFNNCQDAVDYIVTHYVGGYVS